MNIRKYIVIVIGLLLTILLTVVFGYQYSTSAGRLDEMEYFMDNYRFVKIDNKEIKVLNDKDAWDQLEVRGIELSAFIPKISKNNSHIKTSEVMDWLDEIAALNVNVIKILNIQPPSFYRAISNHNENSDNPIYTIHEIPLDEDAILKYHDIFNKELNDKLYKDIKRTVNVMHGRQVIVNNKRGNSGIYLNDISKYNLGYILGVNTNPEIISLTNSSNKNINSYQGKHYSVENVSAFDTFVAKVLDYTINYESEKYDQISLISYLTTVETDPLDYKYETNLTKKAKVNLNEINSDALNNIFTAYKYHPNDVDFLDYEYNQDQDDKTSAFTKQLLRIKNFYNNPVIISDIGISSARGVSKVDLDDGYNRGGFSEIEQGEKIVELLKQIEEVRLSGAIINAWQDVWTNRTSFNMIEDDKDISASSYWHNVLASDESFGLINFYENDKKDSIVIDGNKKDWDQLDLFIDDKIKLKVSGDSAFLYLYLEKYNNLDDVYIGIDVTDKSGSDYWKQQAVKFSKPVDFIVNLNKHVESRVLVHQRYDRFSYQNKYYKAVVDSQKIKPDKNSEEFNPINLLNRQLFYFYDSKEVVKPIYYEAGKLETGSLDFDSKHYNTNADFCLGENFVEVRIPWAMLNIVNPLDMLAYDDFYEVGLENKLKINSLGFSVYDKQSDQVYDSEKNFKYNYSRNAKYEYRLKDSYYILRDYWNKK